LERRGKARERRRERGNERKEKKIKVLIN